MRATCTAAALFVALGVGAATARAGTITGTITAATGGAPISGAQVRVWAQNSKGWTITATVTSNASGVYSASVAAGDYKVDARGPDNGSNYTDRWYDVAAPTGSGYIGEDADLVTVTASGTTSGINIALQNGGGLDGFVLHPTNVLHSGAWVRLERKSDPRMHHNDQSKGSPHLGLFSFRNVPPASDYQLLFYDPTGTYELLNGSSRSITAGSNASIGNLSMTVFPTDPYEGNNTPNCSAPIDSTGLHAATPVPWQSSNAHIGPRGSDPDWYCIQTVAGDRFYIEATTEFSFGGATRYHPWTDPTLSFWAGAGTTKLVEDDDSGTGPLDAWVDTGPLDAGCYCAAVTTFGDSDYNGSGQGSAGRYRLDITMGNRPPVVSIKKGQTEVPGTFTINEGELLDLNLSYADADGDPVTSAFSHKDMSGADVTSGTLTLGGTSGSYTWQVPADGASGSPYTLRLDASESEFAMAKTVQLVVLAVNDPPTVPAPVSPTGGAVIAMATPMLVWSNSTDADGDMLSYDVEVYYDGTDGAAAQTQTVSEGAGGQTSWTVAANIPENTRVYWRVRASDGNGGFSPWSEFAEFLVDSANDPPETPILTKPGNYETVMVRRPGLSVINVTDPESEPIDFIFEIANDDAFTDVVWTSAAVAMNTLAATTMTVPTQDLDWGARYYARARARDARGAESGWSNVRQFDLKDNVAPGTPDFAEGCTALIYDFKAPEKITVNNVVDPEGEQVTFEVEFFLYDDDPTTATPVLRATAQQDDTAATTDIPFDASQLDNGHYRYRVRAFDGTDYSDWIECDLTLDLPPPSSSGGCCDSGAPAPASLLLALLTLLAVIPRRARRTTR